ncbi:protein MICRORCHIDIA 2 [Sesamum angolense]|uniref:Protein MICRORCHIDIA 2 n=1 Tax=Sesamum angolense TaxID=2727404 RepID=A0AAE1W0V0_9LAMI|nr:protein MICRORCHIDIA 2 [Sesamum angolense]
MPPKQQKLIPATAHIVDLDSSDEDDAAAGVSRSSKIVVGKTSNGAKLQTKPPTTTQSASAVNNGDVVSASYGPLDNRSFWRAGAYEIGPTVSTIIQGDLEHARVHPKFLHSNATSHKWAFGAIAELLDNAVDEICNGATFVKVDRIYNSKDNSPALLFQDDGGGMDPESMRKCMSLGYSSKTSNTTIGQYGNGFKTSTMRLGADVIVFSRATQPGRATQSVGLLSYTFLRRTRQDDVIVPMIDFDISDHWAEPIVHSSKIDWSSNLKTILEWSPFASKDDLMLQFDDIGPHGTKIIIFNLWMNDEGVYELNFDDDDEDIRLRDEVNHGNTSRTFKRVLELQSHLSYRIRYSLRAYSSILYLRKFTNFRIILRGKPVEQFSIVDDLKHSKVVTYSPHVGPAPKEVTVETKIGFIKEAPALGVCGFNVYHKNRLIRPYWKVTADGNSRGLGVVGVLEANFIEPAHDKQDFERSTLFIKLESRLKQMVNDYWKAHCHLIGHQSDGMRKNDVQKKFTTQPQVEEVSRNTSKTSLHDKLATVQPILGFKLILIQKHLKIRHHNQICEENIQLFMRKCSVDSKSRINPSSVWSSVLFSVSLAFPDVFEPFPNRCEEYKEKQGTLRRKIEELENELEETRKKSARLSSHLEIQRKQMLLTRQ